MTSDKLRIPTNARPDEDARVPGLEERLLAHFRAEVPATIETALDRWAIEAQTRGSASRLVGPHGLDGRDRRPGQWSRRATWATAIAASLSVVVILATVATAAGLVEWGHYFQRGFGTGRIADEDLGTDLNLTQQVDGFTVTIGRVYADPYSVAMTVRITPPAGLPAGSVNLRAATLYDQDGQFLGGPGVQGGTDDDTMVRTFYNNAIPAGATTVRYRYEITDLRYMVQPTVENDRVVPIEDVVPGTPCQREPPYRGQPAGQSPNEDFCYLIASQPLVFDFEVPLGPGVSVVPGEQTSHDGTIIDVTRLSAGRIGASLDVAGVGPFASVTIETGGQSYPLTTYGLACPYDATTRFNYTTDQPIPLNAGPWTVTVSADPSQQPEQLGRSGELRACPRLDVGGDWAFTVDPVMGAVEAP